MKDKKHGHRHRRNARGFEKHALGNRVVGDNAGKGAVWRIFRAGNFYRSPVQPHFRITARICALPGKHLRSVREPVRATHCRTE